MMMQRLRAPEGTLGVQVGEEYLRVVQAPLKDGHREEGVDHVLRVVVEVGEGVSLDNEDVVLHPLVAVVRRNSLAHKLHCIGRPVEVPAGHETRVPVAVRFTGSRDEAC